MTHALAECLDVSRSFGEHIAVDRVSLAVQPGEIVGLLGANGAGKTTLLRMLLGLLPASSGEVRLLGRSPSRASLRRIGYVPQGLGLYEDLTPLENLRFAQAVYRVPDAELPDDLAKEALPVGRLPLGTQRRVAFAQALVHQPDLLILDEPTSGVGPLVRARLWELLRDTSDAGAGVLVTTHYMEEAEECDRLVIMAEGRIVAEGTLSDILRGERVVVVEAEDWTRALTTLEKEGIKPALVGRTLRVVGSSQGALEKVLAGQGCTLREAPATLEERFVQIAAAGPSRAS